MPVSLNILLRADFPFKWASSYIKYLGIRLTSKIEDLFSLNFPPLLMDIKKDLQKWQTSMFPWFGRCSIIKMNIMPRILYHLQTLPIRIPNAFLKAANRALVMFVWARKPPQLAQSILRLPKNARWNGSPGCDPVSRGMPLDKNR